MKYWLIVLPSAKADIKEAARWMRQYSQEKAKVWLDGIYDAIKSLETFPARCALVPLSDAFSEEIRQLFYGKGREVYRVLFTIQDEIVFILRVLHSAQEIESKL